MYDVSYSQNGTASKHINSKVTIAAKQEQLKLYLFLNLKKLRMKESELTIS